MRDTLTYTKEAFKGDVFIWEVVFTAVVFAAVIYFFKDFKKKEAEARKVNSKFKNGQSN